MTGATRKTAAKTGTKKTAAMKTADATADATADSETDVPTDVPTVRVACGWPQCSQYGTEVETPAGVLVASGVLLTGSLSCMTCGMTMLVLGGT